MTFGLGAGDEATDGEERFTPADEHVFFGLGGRDEASVCKEHLIPAKESFFFGQIHGISAMDELCGERERRQWR